MIYNSERREQESCVSTETVTGPCGGWPQLLHEEDCAWRKAPIGEASTRASRAVTVRIMGVVLPCCV